jgi:mitochondrial fission protein ELM1
VRTGIEHCWILSDGAAGNRRPAQALAEALGCAPSEFVLEVAAPWRWLAPRWLPGSPSVFGPAFERALGQPPQLAIGCGRQAALATRWLKARFPQCRAVQILDPRIDSRHWDAVLAPAHDDLHGAKVLPFTGGLHGIDGATLARARIAFAELAQLPAPRTLLLLGGPHRGYRFDRHAWAGLREILLHWQARDGGSLLVSSSRRTPAWLREAARTELSSLPGRQWHGEVDGSNPYAGFLAWADRIVVTPDSANMLAEACATAAPVLCPLATPLRGKLASLYRELLECGRVRPLKPEYQPWTVQPLRETARIAVELRARLGLVGP